MHLFLAKVCTLHVATITQTHTLSFSARGTKPAVGLSLLSQGERYAHTNTALLLLSFFGMKPHKVETEASILESPLNAFVVAIHILDGVLMSPQDA